MAWFSDRHFFALAVVLYGVSTIYSVFLWRKGFRRDDHVNYLVLLGAFGLHTTATILRRQIQKSAGDTVRTYLEWIRESLAQAP